MSFLSRIKNYYFPIPNKGQGIQKEAESFNVATNIDMSPDAIKKNLSNYIPPVQLARIRVALKDWRESVAEAERAYYPYRVRMQTIFIDTELNGHVMACRERRKDLTLLRKYEFYTGNDDDSAVVDLPLTQWFAAQTWFDDFVNHALDAIFFGYSLISLGDIVSDNFKEVSVVRRWNISPDRHQVSNFLYNPGGIDWRQEPYSDWHVYVKTPNTIGTSPCGYGLFYYIALYEIIMRNLIGYNSDFVELYSQPYRVGKTTKTTERERAQLEAAIQNMGSAGWAIIDPTDEIIFLETALGGTGWQGYDNLEKRCMQTITKLVLGHADALDSIPGKLGNDSVNSPAQVAMNDKAAKDAKMIQSVVIEELLPRMQKLGFEIPEGVKFRYKNDMEKKEISDAENKSNATVATIAKDMKTAGLQMDPKYFTERTGIPATVAPVPEPIKGDNLPEGDKKVSDKIKNRLKRIYGT
jgi:hypothetical protein